METTADIKYNKEALVVQANELIRSRQDELTLVEIKLIRLAISQIVETDIDLRTYTCSITELAKHLGLAQDNLYRDVEQIGKSLIKKVIYVKDTTKPLKKNGQYNYELFPWVDYFSYRDGKITIRLSDKLKPLLIGLNEQFTRYGYSNVVSLPTPNSIRLLELLTSYENIVNPYKLYQYEQPFPNIEKSNEEMIFSVDYLREYFNCTNKYSNNNMFISRVIAPSVAAINEKSTTHKVSYRTVKKGKKIAYILFMVNAWSNADFMEFIRPSKAED